MQILFCGSLSMLAQLSLSLANLSPSLFSSEIRKKSPMGGFIITKLYSVCHVVGFIQKLKATKQPRFGIKYVIVFSGFCYFQRLVISYIDKTKHQ